jgi:phenylalanyl-tRNA synthetase beta subunit
VGEGKKSVTFSLMIEDGEKTITDAEVLEIQTRIVDGMKNDGYFLRTA